MTQQSSTRNAHNILRALATSVGERLMANGVTITEYVPYIAVLQEIMRQPEPVKSRLMAELKSMTFNISCSEEIRVMWDRRPYTVGPVVQAYTLPVAIKILQRVTAENGRLSAVNVNGVQDVRPYCLFWETFKVKRSGEEESAATHGASAETVHRGSTYQWLLHQYKQSNHFERRWGGTELKPNVDDVFRAKLPGAPVQTVQDYSELSGSVIHDWKPSNNKGQLSPGAVQGALVAPGAPSTAPAPPAPPPPPPVPKV